MPLSLGKSKKAFSHNVAAEMHAGKPQDQAVAIAYSQKRKAEYKADGGEVGDDDALMSHVAKECMAAIKSGNEQQFMNALQVLVHDAISKSQGEE